MTFKVGISGGSRPGPRPRSRINGDSCIINTIKNRFYSKILLPDENGCMIWIGSKSSPMKYGYFKIRDKEYTLAHRYSYILHYGEIKNNLLVLHKCDNGSCVAPNHLFLGTQLENMQDRDSKGHGHHQHRENIKEYLNKIRFIGSGEKNNHAKLKECDVIEIRKNTTMSTKELQKKYNVSQSAILRIKNFKSWRHI